MKRNLLMEGGRKKIPEKSVKTKSKHCEQWEWERKSREKNKGKARERLEKQRKVS